MIKAVLFDLDNTLLDINLSAFIARYLWAEARVLARIGRTPVPVAYAWLLRCYLAVDSATRQDDLTGRELFDKTYLRLSGVPLDDPTVRGAIDCLEGEWIDHLRDGVTQARPRPGARRCVRRAQELGYTVALATNPVFSSAVDSARLRWAGLDDIDFALVSTLENSRRSKPSARYYQEFIASLGFVPEECLMVGNDAGRDIPRPDIGLRTAYVGHGWPRAAAWRGSIGKLADELGEFVARLDAENEGCR
nr:HAD family hydrolase [uncultured Olsenella sp.]